MRTSAVPNDYHLAMKKSMDIQNISRDKSGVCIPKLREESLCCRDESSLRPLDRDDGGQASFVPPLWSPALHTLGC